MHEYAPHGAPARMYLHVSRMGTEIERKFLVDVARLPREALREGSRFVQGYLSLSPTVRVRVSERPGLPAEAWITVKGPGGLMRAEFEYAIPVDDARAMVLLCVASLRKTRFRVLVGDHVWDLDQYHDRYEGLWIAEIELDEPDEDFVSPAWVTEEVTDDPGYTNAAIALGSLPTPSR